MTFVQVYNCWDGVLRKRKKAFDTVVTNPLSSTPTLKWVYWSDRIEKANFSYYGQPPDGATQIIPHMSGLHASQVATTTTKHKN